MKKPLLSIQDVGRLLNISRRTVYYWIDKGMLKPIRMGGVLRFHPEDVEALVESNRAGAPVPKRRILAVDDDILVRESLRTLLGREGYDVTAASGGREALELLSREVFDLVITDARMPEVSGIDLLKAVRDQRAQFGKTPLPEIILTAYDDHLVKAEAERLGVRDFVLKPFDLGEFLALIKRKLG